MNRIVGKRHGMRSVGCGLAMLALAIGVSAQRTGQVRLFIDPGHSFEFVLDDKYRMQQRELKLVEGLHRFQFWAPTRRIEERTIMIHADSVINYHLELPYSEAYVRYQNELAQLRREQWLLRGVPAMLAIGSGAYAVSSFFNYRNAHQQLEDDLALYESSSIPAEIRRLKNDDIPQHKDDFFQARTRFFVSSAVFAGFTTWTVFAIRKAARKPVPTFEDTERVRFDGLVWLPGPGGGTWGGGLSLSLQ